LKPEWRRQTADGSLQQTQAVKHFHRNLLPSAFCRLCSGGNFLSKNDQIVAGEGIEVACGVVMGLKNKANGWAFEAGYWASLTIESE